ncbi:trihelix transcription factor GT-2 [Cryptomeria japonica]|uniref:trihelix transcription factor GT-2 n=1 Tax=Cryptomeria japonica TaxID=3369 RepID=UPI0027DA02CB|nr:trihelix transcription factor GT-2 [Cryptomeria japonica]
MYSTQSPFSSLSHPSISSQPFHMPISSSAHLAMSGPGIAHPNSLAYQSQIYHHSTHLQIPSQLRELCQPQSISQPLCDIVQPGPGHYDPVQPVVSPPGPGQYEAVQRTVSPPCPGQYEAIQRTTGCSPAGQYEHVQRAESSPAGQFETVQRAVSSPAGQYETAHRAVSSPTGQYEVVQRAVSSPAGQYDSVHTVTSPPCPGQQYTIAETPVSSSAYCASNPEAKGSEKIGAAEYEDEAEGEDNKKKEKEREHHKKRSKNWTKAETSKLIRLRTEFEPRFAKGGKKSEIWDEIAEAFRNDQFCRDAQQCRDKWEKLAAAYKGVRDGAKDRDDNPFFEEMHPLLGGKVLSRKDKERDRDQEAAELSKVAVVSSETAARDYEADHNDAAKRNYDYYRDEEEWEADMVAQRGKKRRLRPKYIAVSDLSAVKDIVGTVFEKQQELFRDVLENVERREQMRELARQEKEEKWRAEERAQREVFQKAMLVLLQRLVGDGAGNFESGALTIPPVSSFDGNNQVLKKRSKNWKRAEVLQLIRLRGEMDSKFSESTRRGLLWDQLADCLMAQGIKRDAKQCKEKWDKLAAEYKDVVDEKKDASLSPYFAEVAAILGRHLVNSE